jgi:molybdopterin synthase sulfur carrier subunit
MSMQLKVLYFAQLRERFGLSEESLSTPDHVANISDLITLLAARGGVWQDTFSAGGGAFRVAMNQDMVTLDRGCDFQTRHGRLNDEARASLQAIRTFIRFCSDRRF